MDDDDQCFNWVAYPLELFGANGGLLGNTPLICGGIASSGLWSTDECYSLNGETSTFVTKMSAKRWTAASVVLNETILWITEGRLQDLQASSAIQWQELPSSEYITLSGSTPGPELPMPLNFHAMVAINTTYSMIIGGHGGLDAITDDLNLTFYFDHQNQQWIDGPRLIEARKQHAVGIVNDQVIMKNIVIVTGGYKGYYHY